MTDENFDKYAEGFVDGGMGASRLVRKAYDADIARLNAELTEARTLLTDALRIIDNPVYRDKAGARPNIHPRADDIRAFLTKGETDA